VAFSTSAVTGTRTVPSTSTVSGTRTVPFTSGEDEAGAEGLDVGEGVEMAGIRVGTVDEGVEVGSAEGKAVTGWRVGVGVSPSRQPARDTTKINATTVVKPANHFDMPRSLSTCIPPATIVQRTVL
jgi:hypothetical protein